MSANKKRKAYQDSWAEKHRRPAGPTRRRFPGLYTILASSLTLLGCDNLGIHIGPPTLPTPRPVDQSAALKREGLERPERDEVISPSNRSDDPAGTGREIIRPYTEWNLADTAADALGRIGQPAVDELIKYLDDPNPLIRIRAIRVLARIGPDAFQAVPALRQCLRDSDTTVRSAAARALGQIGPAAAEAIPDLIQALGDPSSSE